MKMAKRVLALIVSVIMIVGTCAVAASAAVDYQAELDAGRDITLEADTQATFTVTKDVTIDLGGHTLKSEYGKPAIIINGGNVTVTNGQVYSMFAQVPSMELLKTVFTKSPSGIVVNGGNLTVDGVRVVGSMARVPTTKNHKFPTGTAIMTKNGANVTLKRATLVGDYGVNDQVTGAQPGGTVTVEDAIILAYNRIIKSGVDGGKLIKADGTEKINAADRVEGFLNSGVKLEARERKILKDVFDERAYVFTKEPTPDQVAKITVTEGVAKAEVEAETISYLWPNTTSTDCSYELVPEAVIYSDGTSAALDSVDAAKVDEDAQIRYRVKFQMCDDIAGYVNTFVEDPEWWIDLNWWGHFIQDEYEWNLTNNAGPIDSYNEAVIAIGDALKMLDDLGNEPVPGVGNVDDIALYNQLRVALVELGGATAYNKATGRTVTFDDSTYTYYYGRIGQTKTEADFNAQNGVFGTLDRVQKLLDGVAQYAPFTDTSKWGDIAVYAYDNYQEIINIVKDAGTKIANLQAILADDTIQYVINMNDNLKKTAAYVNDYASDVVWAVSKIDEVMAYPDVQATLDAVEANKGEIKTYVDKFVGIAENFSTYFTPSNFVEEDLVKAYATYGGVIIDRKSANKNLDIYRTGEGWVNYSLKQLDKETEEKVTVAGAAVEDEQFQSIEFIDEFTLTAVPAGDYTFLYWVNEETDRILSTELTLAIDTNVDRSIKAVFTAIEEPLFTFTNPTGAIAGYGWVEENVVSTDGNVPNPAIPGYVFKNWPAAVIDLNAYYGGSASAFADPAAFYGKDGATLAVRPGLASMIITPVYDRSANYTVQFIDPAQPDIIFQAVAPFGDTATVTAIGENFSYWADENGKAVCLTPEYTHTIVKDGAKFHAVYNATDIPEQILVISATDARDERVYFYASRSITGTLLSTGIVFHYTNPKPEVGMDGAVKGVSKSTANNGMYYGGIKQASIRSKGNGTIYARPFAETAEDGLFYGDTITYKLG